MKNSKICLFAGTTEGRNLARFLQGQCVDVTVCVATDYGQERVEKAANIHISSGRLSAEDMCGFFAAERFALVIDATHPYAAAVTQNIKDACRKCGISYLRLSRQSSDTADDVVCVSDADEAAAFLEHAPGRVLLTTGSKELQKYRNVTDFARRFYARVLPMEDSLKACRDAGLAPDHILAVQGPFSEAMNVAMLQFVHADWLVTKDGGKAGGFDEKVTSAQKAGARLLVIGRPEEEAGSSYGEVVSLLCSRFGCRRRPDVTIAGIGPGNQRTMTEEVLLEIEQAECLIGAGRMLESVRYPQQPVFEATAPGQIASFIAEHTEYSRFAVVMSGDTGFFSGTKKLLPLLKDCRVKVLPGISSLSALCARIGTSYEDVTVRSLHGREHDIIPDLRRHRRLFVLTGGTDGINRLCQSLCDAGMEQVSLTVAEKLSYPEEKITRGTAGELVNGVYDSLSVALIEKEANEESRRIVTAGLPDACFERGTTETGLIPMTKSEVRAVCLSKLQLPCDAVCYDVGAGTGSVAIEMARLAEEGTVYAIERKEEAVRLIKKNAERFQLSNLHVTAGVAPDALRSLPAPTHVFIGGSSGNMKEILTLLLQKNPAVRIVATAISLESAAELTACLKAFSFTETEVVSLTVARDHKAGPYHLMTGQNPIFIYSMQAGGEAL